MVLLDNDAFLSELTRMFQRSRTSGSVTLTMKRYDGRTKPKPSAKKSESEKKQAPAPSEYKCLIRAALKTKKISTVVVSKDVNKYQQAYNDLLKGNMSGLRKVKKVKTKAKAT